MFSGCISLERILFDPNHSSAWAGKDLNLSNCNLSHPAIVAFFQSLPTITGSAIITLTGNPGLSQLSSNDRLIATNKNWTVA